MLQRTLQRALSSLCALSVLCTLVLGASFALAHESKLVGAETETPYLITVGFTVNPAYTGILNGLDLIITEARPEDLEGADGGEGAGEGVGGGAGHAHGDHEHGHHSHEHGHDEHDGHGHHNHDHSHDHSHDYSHDHSHGGAGVENLAPGLSAQIISPDGQSTLELELIDLGGGRYTATFVPTESGNYPIRIFGFIGELEVDETFEAYAHSDPGVLPLEDISIP
jgi:hypothetical protein